MKYTWLSAHLYYGEPFEEFLIKGVKPFVEKLRNENLMEGYFFIRYWERGPHIRLRILGNSKILDEKVKPCLCATFEKYLKDHPSERQEPEWVKNLPDNRRWFRNNSIQFIVYEPETVRYGGKYTLPLAEDHFHNSSDTVLEVLSLNKKWNYHRALGTALQLHLSFAYAIGLNKSLTRRFFSGVYSRWLPHAYQLIPASAQRKEQKKFDEILVVFKKTFNDQKSSLLPFINSYWQFLESGDSFEEDWLNKWIEYVRKTDKELRIKQDNRQLTSPYAIQLQEPLKHAKAKEMLERWSIFYSYIHMTNNRLGILNRDEAYLGFILKEVF